MRGQGSDAPVDATRRALVRAAGAVGLLAAMPWWTHGVAATHDGGREHLYTFEFPEDGSRLVGGNLIAIARPDDTLLSIVRRYDVGYWDIVLANPDLDLWLPGEGTPVLVPRAYLLPDAPREGIVVNIPEMRLYYYPEPAPGARPTVVTHPVGIGRQDWSTPLGETGSPRKPLGRPGTRRSRCGAGRRPGAVRCPEWCRRARTTRSVSMR